MVTVLVGAIFLARYGRNRDWWFGFSAFGRASILFSVPGLWNAEPFQKDGFDWFNLTNSLGDLLQRWRGEPPDGPSDYYFTGSKFAAVLQFWATMTLSFVGGYLALFIRFRSKDTTESKDEQAKRGGANANSVSSAASGSRTEL